MTETVVSEVLSEVRGQVGFITLNLSLIHI